MTAPEPNDLTGVDALLIDIAIIDQLVSAIGRAALAPDLGLSGFGVLNHCVVRGDGDTPSRLARAFQVSKASMTATLQKLVRHGFVTLSADSGDGRSKRVAITPAGRERHAYARRRLTTAVGSDLSGFDLSVLSNVAPALRQLRMHLDKRRNRRDRLY